MIGHVRLPARTWWRRSFARHCDEGLGLVEVVVAIAVLAIVLVPAMHVLTTTLETSSNQRLEVEAIGVASSMLDQLERQAAAGPLPTGDQHQTVTVASVPFQVDVHFAVTPNASGSTECSGSQIQSGLQIWLVSASVTWPNMANTAPVVEKTEVAPGATGALIRSAGELAVELTDLNGNPITNSNPPVQVQVIGTLDSADYPSTSSTPPTGETTNATGNIGTDGCAVFPNLDADPGWTYTVTLAGNPGWVSANEESDNPSAGSVPTYDNITLQEGKVTVISGASFPALAVAPGVTVNPSGVQGTFFSTVGAAQVPPAANIPITVTLPTSGSNTHTFGTGSAAIQSLLLYPFNAIYSAWSGDEAEANPNFQYASGPNNLANLYGVNPPVPLTIPTTSSTTTAKFPVYPLELSLNAQQQDPSNVLTARETDGIASYALGAAGAVIAATSATGLPLGQYELSESNGASPLANPYVWVTPTGVFASSTEMTASEIASSVPQSYGPGQAVPES